MEKERLELSDGDFLDLEWKRGVGNHLVVICHGMEGSADRPYIHGMVNALSTLGLDILAWNYRSCSGEMNRLPRFYHSGATEDLQAVIDHSLQWNPSYHISLVGFSLGGNLILKYLGERGSQLSHVILGGLAISVPLDLDSCCRVIDQPSQWLYAQRFLKTLLQKVRDKERLIPGSMPMADIHKINSLRAFDDYVTGPLHGFQDASDYYRQCNSLQFLPEIRVPVWVVNAKNDPFLSPKCFPEPSRLGNHFVHLLYPRHGGHVGFSNKPFTGYNAVEQLARILWGENIFTSSH
jgi:predicted alpha/beta-fold hydrolase